MTKGGQFCCTFHNQKLIKLQKLKIVNTHYFFGQVMHDWRDVCANFTLIDVKSLEILSSLVAY